MVSYTLRMSEPIKNQLDEFCDKMGMNLTTFFMLYVKKTLRDQKIPFELGLEPAVKKGKYYSDNMEETLAAVAEGKELAYNEKVKGYSNMDELRAALEE